MARKRKKHEPENVVVVEDEAQDQHRARLTPVDVQQKVFRLAFRGYNEGDVDEFLDLVTESLAALHEENKRLLEQLQEAGAGGSAGALAAAQRQADAIVSQAREQAARIAEEGGGAPVVAGGPPTSFLVRERAFLQRIASLVQDHARVLKQEARKTRETSGQVPEAPREAAGTTAAAGIGGAALLAEGSPEETAGAGPAEAAVGGPEEAVSGGGSPHAPEGEGDEAQVEPPSQEGSAQAEPGTDEPQGPRDVAPVEPASADPDERGDVTAPWRPVNAQGAEGPRQEGSSDEDPLVSAWESAFVANPGAEEPSEARTAPQARGDRKEDEEPSLRELFWGEE
jgi:DivIVA domain-containing protein